MSSIACDSTQQIWVLSTPSTSYVVRVTEDSRVVQTHWGPRLTLEEACTVADYRQVVRKSSWIHGTEIDEQLPVDGGLRWGVPSLQVTFPGGVRSLELGFVGARTVEEATGRRATGRVLMAVGMAVNAPMSPAGDWFSTVRSLRREA